MFKHKFIRDKNFILLFFGNLVSGVGSRIHGFGISLFLLDLTGKASSMATYIAIWTFILFVMGPIAATYTDRWKHKVRVLYVTDFGRAIIYLLSALGVFYFDSIGNDSMVLATIYSLLIFIAVQTAFFAPSVTSLIPQLVDSDELVSASSIMQITRSIQNIAGLFLGALLYLQFGIVILMVINAMSFILSAISEMFIKNDNPKNNHRLDNGKQEEVLYSENKLVHESKRVYNDLKEAVVYIVRDSKPILMVTILILVSSTLVGPWFSIGVPYMIKEYFAFTSLEPEYILASSEFLESIGVILMSLIVASIAKRFKIYQLFRFGCLAFAVIGILYFIIIRSFDISVIEENSFIIIFLSVNLFAGMVNATINAPLQASLQKYIDPNKIGKVVMIIDSFGGILFPLTALLAGYLIDYHSLYYPIMMMISAMFIMTFISFKSKALKELV